MKIIILIDDNPVIISATKAIIDTMESFEVIGDASSCAEGIILVQEIEPYLAIVDLNIERKDDGFDLISKLKN